jgi:hypothetical protein
MATLAKIEGIVVRGLGAARTAISRQKLLVAEHFPDIAKCHDGTINLQLSRPLQVRLPDIVTPPLAWNPDYPNFNEKFGITEIELELEGKSYRAWLYTAEHSPHRFNNMIAEIIAEPIIGIVTGLKCAICIKRLQQLLVI